MIKHKQHILERSFIKDWHPVKTDAGVILEEISLQLLEDSWERMTHMMEYHHIQFFRSFFFPPLFVQPYSFFAEFHPTRSYEGRFLKAGTRLYLQQEDLLPMLLQEDIMVQHTVIDHAVCFDPERMQLYQIDQPMHALPLFDPAQENELCYRFRFAFSNCFYCMDQPSFLLYLEGCTQEETMQLLDLFLSEQFIWHVYVNDMDTSIKLQREENHLCVQLLHSFTMQEHEVCFDLTAATSDIPDCTLQDVFLSYCDDRSFLDGVIQNEVELRPEKFPLFDAPLSLFQSTYFRCDHVFSRLGSTITWKFQMEELLYTVMPELIEQKQYHLLMRRLPREQIIYEVLAEQIQIEYFNGEWCAVPGTAVYREMGKGASRMMTLTFRCPEDALPFTVFGICSYWLRMTLVKSQNCYMMPAYHHIPVLLKHRLSFHYEQHRLQPIWMKSWENGEVHDLMEERQKKEAFHLFKKRSDVLPTLYLKLTKPPKKQPLRLYIECQYAYAQSDEIHAFAKGKREEAELILQDHTGGFSHSGQLSIYFPDDFEETMEFQQKGFWVRFVFHHRAGKKQCITRIRSNCAAVCLESEQIFYDKITNTSYPVILDLPSHIHPKKIAVKEIVDGESVWKPLAITAQKPAASHTVQLQQHQLIFSYSSFEHITLSSDDPNIKIIYAPDILDQTIEEDTPLLLADSDPNIAGVQVMEPVHITAGKETEEHCMQRLSHMLRSRNTVFSLYDIEERLLDEELGLDKVKVCFAHQQRCLHVYVLWSAVYREQALFAACDRLKQLTEQMLDGLGAPCSVEVKPAKLIDVDVSIQVKGAREVWDQLEKQIRDYLDPHTGGNHAQGWQLGEYAASKQLQDAIQKSWKKIEVVYCQLYGIQRYGAEISYQKLEQLHEAAGMMRCRKIELDGEVI